jgi:hypothetical protein
MESHNGKTIEDLYNIIESLHDKHNQLEKKCKFLEENMQYANEISRHKKDRVDENEEYLQMKKNISYSDYIEEIEINDEHLQIYYDNSYEDAFIKTIERVLSFQDLENIPFYRTQSKKLVFYENNKWEQMTRVQIENFVYKIHTKVMQNVLTWQQKHNEELECSEKMQQWFHGLLKKLTTRRAFSIDKVKKRLVQIMDFDNKYD